MRSSENECSTCTSCMSSGTNIRHQLPSTKKIKLPVLTEPAQEIQMDFSGKLPTNHLTGEPYNIIGIDRYINWTVVRMCKSTETKKVINFLESFVNLYGVPEKTKSDRGSAFISKEYEEFYKTNYIELEYSPPRLPTGTGVVENAIQTLTNLIFANLEDKIGFTESIKRALRVMRFMIHTGSA